MASTARLDELKKKFDENPRRYFAPLANEHRKSGDLDQAISLCRAHLPLQPAHISGHIVLAQALFEAGSIDESREIFLAALGLDPENLIALRYLGDIAREASDVDTARSWYHRVLEVDPRNDEIVQLVRDLDTPLPVPASESEPFDAPPVAAVAPPSVVAAPSTPVNNDARFAPLSMEDFDIGAESEADVDAKETADAASPAAAEDSFDLHAEWSTPAASTEHVSSEAPELDPFELHPSASAESLFDGHADAEANDLFLSELSGVNAPDDGGDFNTTNAEDPWAAATEELPAPSTPSHVEDSFEEGSFYLEPPPSSPNDEADSVNVAPEESAQSAEVSATHEPAMADPNAEALALFADSQTAEWRPPTSDAPAASADELGLEVMEFVPPSSEATPPSILEAPSDADPLLGRTPQMEAGEQESTPLAFVTETMAELYLQQGFRNEALAVYRELLSRNPTDESLRDRIDKIESGSMSSLGMATLSEGIVESALQRQAARPERSVRSFFASLASRRAPSRAPELQIISESTDSTEMLHAPVAPEATDSDFSAMPEPTNVSEPLSESPTPPAAPESERIAPLMSAAETLASFDPFADASESVTSTAPADGPSAIPDAWAEGISMLPPSMGPDASLGETPAAQSSDAPAVEPVAEVDRSVPAGRSLEDLFPDAPVTARTEAAAQTLATAFGRDEPQGRPTRAASNELSLDHVFRGTPEGSSAPDGGGFSFDQFFSDARPAGGGDTAPAVAAHDTGRSAGPSGDAHDIEQFTAWLEGLKKK